MIAPTDPHPGLSLIETPLIHYFVICTLIMKPSNNPDELLKAMELHHELYIANLRLLHGLTLNINSPTALPKISGIERSRSHDSLLPTPPRGSAFSHDSLSWCTFGSNRCWHQTDELHSSRPYHFSTQASSNDRASQTPTMADNNGDDLLCYSFCTTKPIEQESFTEQDLRTHLASLNSTNWAVEEILQVRRGDEYIDAPQQSLEPWEERGDDTYKNATYEVYEIPGSGDQKCIPEPKHKENGDDPQQVLSINSVWDTLKEVNMNGKAVGRIT